MAEPEGSGHWETTDMSMAAWMRARGVDIVSIQKLPHSGRQFRFVFRDPENRCNDLALAFLNSDAHAFDTAMRALKKLCFGPNGVQQAGRGSR
jgi:hypothetical protein